jgi:hypothetical protein
MTDLSSITSSATAFVAKQTAQLNKAASDVNNGFTRALNNVETTIGVKPKTGFTSGPTYEANSLTGQTKAAFNNALNATKSALHIKP